MPARKPSALKRLQGTWRPDRANPREPQPPPAAPRPSRPLALEERREFDKLVRRLLPLRVLSQADGLAVELCALSLAETWGYAAVVRERGATYSTTTPQGSQLIRVRPEVALMADAHRRATALLQQLGLTPASRAKVETLPPGEAPGDGRDKWAGMFKPDPVEKARQVRTELLSEARFP